VLRGMTYSVEIESPESLRQSWLKSQHLKWDCIFVLPWWLEAWCSRFGSRLDQYLCSVAHNGTAVGFAPLLLEGRRGTFLGSRDMCDYLDFVIAPGRAEEFFTVLLRYLHRKSITHLELHCLRPDSTAITDLATLARNQGHDISITQENRSMECELPGTWEAYLDGLEPKQRHELKRRLRRLSEAGDMRYSVVSEPEAIQNSLGIFLRLLKISRIEKARFMTGEIESFFANMTQSMAKAGLARLGFLELNGFPVAAVMYFDYRNAVYLYNSGYDPEYSSLSVGLISKVMCIRDSIERGKKKFDFMKGDEPYKQRLGGREIPIYRCDIELK
jgi:CelD/BcsL family acetyltransferase involved in cellulose biosynthesis